MADPVHAIVPVSPANQREAMAPDRQAPVEGARAVLEQGPRRFGDVGLEIHITLPGREGHPLEERNNFIEQAGLPGDLKVVENRVRQPEQIIGELSPHPPARRRVPPVLDVALGELPRGGPFDMLTRDVPLSHRERHHVLELITKAIRAA